MATKYVLSSNTFGHKICLYQGCQERHDPFQEPAPPITAFRSLDYGYTRMTAHNATHMEIEQVSDDKVN